MFCKLLHVLRMNLNICIKAFFHHIVIFFQHVKHLFYFFISKFLMRLRICFQFSLLLQLEILLKQKAHPKRATIPAIAPITCHFLLIIDESRLFIFRWTILILTWCAYRPMIEAIGTLPSLFISTLNAFHSH